MTDLDKHTRALAGGTIWNVAQWLEAHNAGEPHEIFSDIADADKFGYRLTVERIPWEYPVARG